MPATYILRVTEGACADLGITHPEDDDQLDELHVLVQKFADHYFGPAGIDAGEPFAQMKGKAVFRLKRNEWRGLVWADKEAGVMWLCRAVHLANFTREDLAYNSLAAVGEAIFPTDAEREHAARERMFIHALGSLRGAMQEAHRFPEVWHEARIRGANQTFEEAEVVGQAYVEPIAADDDDNLEVRYLIALRKPPTDLISGREWGEAIMATLFPPQGGAVIPIRRDELPGWPTHMGGPELVLAQDSA